MVYHFPFLHKKIPSRTGWKQEFRFIIGLKAFVFGFCSRGLLDNNSFSPYSPSLSLGHVCTLKWGTGKRHTSLQRMKPAHLVSLTLTKVNLQ